MKVAFELKFLIDGEVVEEGKIEIIGKDRAIYVNLCLLH